MTKNKVRVGLLLDSASVPAWAYRMIEKIGGLSFAEIVLVARDGQHAGGMDSAVSIPKTAGFSNGNCECGIAYRKYMGFENKRFQVEADAFASKSLSALLSAIPNVELDQLKQQQLDVLVQIGSHPPDKRALNVARHGVWALRSGDDRTQRGGPEGFWEVFQGETITGAALYSYDSKSENVRVLSRTYSHTDPMRVKQSLNAIYWKTLSLVPRQLERLHRLGPDEFEASVARENRDPVFYSRPHHEAPRNLEFIPLLLRHLVRYVKRYLHNKLFFHQWILLFDFRQGLSTEFWRFKALVPPKDRIWADPCIVFRDGKYHVFFEEYFWKKGRGHISTMTIDENGKASQPIKVLERPYHLSYPHVFQWNGVDYMIPETLESGSIEVYRCERFPDKWVFETSLIDGIRAADTTLLQHAGKWWLFANVVENVGASSWDELFIYSADSPLSKEWKPHPMNPVISDVRRARPAGKIIQMGGELYRPAQDCGKGYGSGLRVNRILKLSETEYQEAEVSVIEPRWSPNLVGVHTLSHEGRLTMIDAIRCRSKFLG